MPFRWVLLAIAKLSMGNRKPTLGCAKTEADFLMTDYTP